MVKYMALLIVKRQGHKEQFDERKLYSSCFFALRSAGVHEKDAEPVCEKVVMEVKQWLHGKTEIDSNEIFEKTAEIIKKFHEDGSFMYRTHRDIS